MGCMHVYLDVCEQGRPGKENAGGCICVCKCRETQGRIVETGVCKCREARVAWHCWVHVCMSTGRPGKEHTGYMLRVQGGQGNGELLDAYVCVQTLGCWGKRSQGVYLQRQGGQGGRALVGACICANSGRLGKVIANQAC